VLEMLTGGDILFGYLGGRVARARARIYMRGDGGAARLWPDGPRRSGRELGSTLDGGNQRKSKQCLSRDGSAGKTEKKITCIGKAGMEFRLRNCAERRLEK
jgi:hypothetical protein